MPLSDAQKVDLLFKKIAFGVTKTDTYANKSPSNESISSPLTVYANEIWAEASSIPATPPTASSSIVQVKTVAASGSQAVLSEDPTATPDRTWLSSLEDWIPYTFGVQYAVKAYIGDPGSGGTRIFPDGSGNEDEWYFDTKAGVLHFLGENLPSGISGQTIYIEGYRYIGQKGFVTTSQTEEFDCEAATLIGDLVYFSLTEDNKVLVPSDNNSPGPVMGIVTDKPSSILAEVAFGFRASGFSGLARGKKIYVSSGGALTTTLPTTNYLQTLGIATSATEIVFSPNPIRVKRN